jgi:hypothetical protein
MTPLTAVAQAYVENRPGADYNAASECTRKLDASPLSDDTILAIARRAGMLVMLDGQIGRETYQSVTGSLAALHRFVAELRSLMPDEDPR